MTNRTGQGLNRAKKLLLAAAGVAAVAGPIAVGVLIGVGNAPAIHAQPWAAAAPSPLDVPQAIQPEVTQPTPSGRGEYASASVAGSRGACGRSRQPSSV